MKSNKKKATEVSDAQLEGAVDEYRTAMEKLYNLLLKDSGDGNPLSALGALSLFRIRCEQSILDQINNYASAARRRISDKEDA